MTTIAIVPNRSSNGADFRAVGGRCESVGKTPGEALDALTSQLGPEESGTLLVVQNFRPDAFFTAEQRDRLDTLVSKWRRARDSSQQLSPDEQRELDDLVQAELDATARRAAALADGLAS